MPRTNFKLKELQQEFRARKPRSKALTRRYDMALSIYNNVTSLGAQKYLNIANNAQTKSLQRLSSGLRINTAKVRKHRCCPPS